MITYKKEPIVEEKSFVDNSMYTISRIFFQSTTEAIHTEEINYEQKEIDVNSSIFQINSIPGLGKLKQNIELTVRKDNNIVYIDCSEFDIYVTAQSLEETFKEFYDFFIGDYNNYKRMNPDELTDDANKLLEKYDKYVI